MSQILNDINVVHYYTYHIWLLASRRLAKHMFHDGTFGVTSASYRMDGI